MKYTIGTWGCRILSKLADISPKLHTIRMYLFFHKLTWRDDDWKDETK